MRSTRVPKTPKGVTLTGLTLHPEPDEMPLEKQHCSLIRVLTAFAAKFFLHNF